MFGERILYDDPLIHLVKMAVEPPNGRRFEQHVVRFPRVVVTIVLNEENCVLMMWRHRYVIDRWGWELPGGMVDDGEDDERAAAREVEEETGWRPARLRHLLTFQPMMGLVDCPHVLFTSGAGERIGPPTDPEEVGIVEWIEMDTIRDLIAHNQILGAGSLVALLYVLASRCWPAVPPVSD